MEVEDFVCTRCLKSFDLGYMLKGEGNSVTQCNVCNNENRCCFRLEQSVEWDGVNPYDKSRYNNYYTSSEYYRRIGREYERMWNYGVEINLGITLYFLCNNIDGLIIPNDIIRVIYGLAKQIPRTFRY
jgi:hypothetical protein